MDEAIQIEVLHRAADAAAKVTVGFFRNHDLSVESKLERGYDPVTRADREAEAAIRAVLQEHRPDDAILGEEFGETPGTSGLCWVLDPIDGTRGFVSGTPTWGTLISLGDENGPILGLIDQPYIGERFWGGFGHAEFRRGDIRRPMSVRGADNLADAVLFTTFPEVGTSAEGDAFHAVAAQVKLTRYGMDCYAYALLASGHVDLIIEAGLHTYDIHAPVAVIQAAGGIITDWRGNPAHGGGRVVAAANAELHRAALEILAVAPGLADGM